MAEVKCPYCAGELSFNFWRNRRLACVHCDQELSGEYYLNAQGRRALPFDPVVLFRDPGSGEYQVPGNSADPCPQGLERVEVRDSRHWEKVEREMAARNQTMCAEAFHRDRSFWAEGRGEQMRELERSAKGFSQKGRELADYALERVRAKDQTRKPRSGEAFFPARHFTESHLRADVEQRLHNASRRK